VTVPTNTRDGIAMTREGKVRERRSNPKLTEGQAVRMLLGEEPVPPNDNDDNDDTGNTR
jgi:hypothetical protein